MLSTASPIATVMRRTTVTVRIRMADGEIVEVGTAEHFFEDPREERTQLFISQIL